MPIYNNLFGVWKLLVYQAGTAHGVGDVAYIVKSSKETVNQEANPEFFVQGTALPLIQNIGGGTAELDLNAPLLVGAHPVTATSLSPYQRVVGGDNLHDGYTLWCNVMSAPAGSSGGMFDGWYYADPGFIIKNAGLEVTPQGATYTIGFKGDTNILGNESGTTQGWRVIDPGVSVGGVYQQNPEWNYWWSAPQRPIPLNPTNPNDYMPLRVATFYDIVASGTLGSTTIQGFVERLSINLAVQTKQTNIVGQQTQRPIMGISGVDITFSGTMIWSQRQPFGYQFPWQSMNNTAPYTRVPTANQTWGGTGKYSSFSLSVGLRNGTSNTAVMPLLPYLSVDKAIFTSSSVDVSNDFVRSTFEGKGWVSNPNFLSTATTGTAGGTGFNF